MAVRTCLGSDLHRWGGGLDFTFATTGRFSLYGLCILGLSVLGISSYVFFPTAFHPPPPELLRRIICARVPASAATSARAVAHPAFLRIEFSLVCAAGRVTRSHTPPSPLRAASRLRINTPGKLRTRSPARGQTAARPLAPQRCPLACVVGRGVRQPGRAGHGPFSHYGTKDAKRAHARPIQNPSAVLSKHAPPQQEEEPLFATSTRRVRPVH